jgi:hypothetical protein
VGQSVSGVTGVVTAKVSNGFYLQDPNPDADVATSEGIFVFTSSAPTVNVGDLVSVGGTVAEFRPGGSASANLTTTEIGNPSLTVSVLSSGNVLPAPIVIGTGGRIPPATVIEDDATGSVETSGVFDPGSDGIDFYESVEGMLVQINDAVVVGPRDAFGEIAVVADNGANAAVLTTRGGLVVRSTDFNPERIILDDAITPVPAVNVGDTFPGALVGVLGYSFGNFKLLVTSLPTAVSGGLTRESTSAAKNGEVAIATFDLENLDPTEPATRLDALASQIVDNLASPDIVAVQGILDNNGPVNDGVVDASTTYSMLIAAIRPRAARRQPSPDRSGEQQRWFEFGANTRVGLFRTDRVSLHRSPWRRLHHRHRRSERSLRPRALLQSGPHRPDERGLQQLPQAAGGRVHLQRTQAVRDRGPFQLEGRRQSPLRPLPAARPRLGDATSSASRGRSRLRAVDPVVGLGREHRGARRRQRFRVLHCPHHPQRRRAA